MCRQQREEDPFRIAKVFCKKRTKSASVSEVNEEIPHSARTSLRSSCSHAKHRRRTSTAESLALARRTRSSISVSVNNLLSPPKVR